MNVHRRNFIVGTGAAIATGALTRRATAAPEFKTVKPGVLTIANSGEMPMIGMDGGKLVGSDAEIIEAIATKMPRITSTVARGILRRWISAATSPTMGRGEDCHRQRENQ